MAGDNSTITITVIDDSNDNGYGLAAGWPLPYKFSVGAAVIYFILFLSTALIHTYQIGRTRTWFFIPFLIGVWFEALGYLNRTIAATAYPTYQQWPVFLCLLLPYIAPTFMAASLYMELGRIIRMCGAERLSIIRPTWLTKIFVLGDIITLIGQVIGGSIIANPKATKDQVKLANAINAISFSLQVAFLVLYLLTAVIFHKRYVAQTRANKPAEEFPWRRHMRQLFLAVALILYRSLFHLVEAVANIEFFNNHEWPSFALDSTPIFFVALNFIFVHPSQINAILKGHGLVCTNVFHFERHEPLARLPTLYGNRKASVSDFQVDLQPLVGGGEYHSQTQAQATYVSAEPSGMANAALKPYNAGPNYRYGDRA